MKTVTQATQLVLFPTHTIYFVGGELVQRIWIDIFELTPLSGGDLDAARFHSTVSIFLNAIY